MGKLLYKRPSCFFLLCQNVSDFFHLHACILRALFFFFFMCLTMKCACVVQSWCLRTLQVLKGFFLRRLSCLVYLSSMSLSWETRSKQDSIKEQNTWTFIRFSIIHEHLISIKYKLLFPLHFQFYRKKNVRSCIYMMSERHIQYITHSFQLLISFTLWENRYFCRHFHLGFVR